MSSDHLWTGVGRARSGCGAALVGSADQVLSELERKMGIRAFILSGTRTLTNAGIVREAENGAAQRSLWPTAFGIRGRGNERGLHQGMTSVSTTDDA